MAQTDCLFDISEMAAAAGRLEPSDSQAVFYGTRVYVYVCVPGWGVSSVGLSNTQVTHVFFERALLVGAVLEARRPLVGQPVF